MIRLRVYQIYKTVEDQVTALRLGRIIGMEHKGLLDEKDDEHVKYLLTTSDLEQTKEDNNRRGYIALQKKQYDH